MQVRKIENDDVQFRICIRAEEDIQRGEEGRSWITRNGNQEKEEESLAVKLHHIAV